MSEDTEYPRFDSDCVVSYTCPRVATEPTCIESSKGTPLVRFKVVAERASKDKDGNYRFEPIWLEVNVGQYNAKACSFLEKNDVLGKVRGPLAMRLWGDNNENQSLSLEFAEVTIPPALFKVLKERGFEGKGEPNYTDGDKKPAGKKPANGKKTTGNRPKAPAPNKDKPAASRKPVAGLDDDAGDGDGDGDPSIDDDISF